MGQADDRPHEVKANSPTEALSDRIRAARRDRGWTQQDVALKVGITVRSISGWERGKTIPHLGTLEALARILGQEPDQLVAPAQSVAARRRAVRVAPAAGRIEGALNEMVQHLRVKT